MTTEETNGVRQRPSTPAKLDETDRKLLALLAEDSSRSFAELGRILNLSPPAVHERAKRLKQEKVIKATVAKLDGAKVGRPLLAFVHVLTTSFAVTREIAKFRDYPEVEEIHMSTGECSVILKVRTRDTQSLEDFIWKIHLIERLGTRSYVALSTYLERGPSPDL